jgi:hypothetical protein
MIEIIVLVPDGFNTRDRDACYGLIESVTIPFKKGEVTIVKILSGEKPLDEAGFLLAALCHVAPYGVDLALVGKHLQNKATIICGPNRGKVINV